MENCSIEQIQHFLLVHLSYDMNMSFHVHTAEKESCTMNLSKYNVASYALTIVLN